MASLFDLDNSSDSEDDFDYEPNANELSSEDEHLPSSDDEEAKKESKKRESSKELVLDSEKGSVGEEKKKAPDDIYKSFLDEVASEMSAKNDDLAIYSKNESATSGSESATPISSSSIVLITEKGSTSPQQKPSPKKEEIIEFAGETLSIVDGTIKPLGDTDLSSASRSKTEKAVPAAGANAQPLVKRKFGLDSVLGAIQNKKKKVNVLEKSQLDWMTFKKEENLGEELEKFNRGKGGYIERRRFLERSDVRSYEIERDMRSSKRHTQPKTDT